MATNALLERKGEPTLRLKVVRFRLKCCRWKVSVKPGRSTCHRITSAFGVVGGGNGAVGENRVLRQNGHVEALQGNDEATLNAGDSYEMRTPGGGGWGAP